MNHPVVVSVNKKHMQINLLVTYTIYQTIDFIEIMLIVIMIMGVLDGTSGTSADVPGVGLNMVSVSF